MKHTYIDNFISTAGDTQFEEAIKIDQEQQSQSIKLSNQLPYKVIASFLAAIYFCILLFCGLILHVFFRTKPTERIKKLSELYFFVPEMALHKEIELEQLFKSHFHDKCVDLGCGNGFIGGLLINNFNLKEVTGVDLNEHNRLSCLSFGYKNFVSASITSLPFESCSFNFAYSVCVFEHVKDLKDVLREAHRILVPKGQLSFTTPSPAFRTSTLGYRILQRMGFNSKAKEYQRKKDVSSIQYHYLDHNAWSHALSSAGFRDIKVVPFFSTQQLLIYDLLNIQVWFLRFYFADKVFRNIKPGSLLQKMFTYAASHIVSYMTMRSQNTSSTHWYITAEKEC